MDPLQSNTALLPPPLRALALSLLIEAVVPLLDRSPEGGPVPPGAGEGELWQALRNKCGELAVLVLRADDPREAAAYVLGYLPRHFEDVSEQLFGRKRTPTCGAFEQVRPAALRNGKHHAEPA